MTRNLTFALSVLIGLAAVAEAQPYYRPYAPGPATRPGFGAIEGRWFYEGDPEAPCYVRVIGGGFDGPRLVFINERGEQSPGRFLRGGRVVANNWGFGGMVGEFTGNSIQWQNGTSWSR